MMGLFLKLYRRICEGKNLWRRNRERHVPLRVPVYELLREDVWVPLPMRNAPPAHEGWMNYMICPPRRDLVVQFKRGGPFDEKPFTAIPRQLPRGMNCSNLYWRLTGIAKAQLEANG